MVAPTYQTNFNGYTAFMLQSGIGTPQSGAGATILRQTGGTPGKLSKAAIESKEVRRDAQHTRGRHGMQTAIGGPYACELSVGSFDPILQAVLRGSWDTEISVAAADFTSATTTANTIVWASGNPITKGIRAGDVIEITASATSANNARDLRVTGVSSTAITIDETLTVDSTPDTSLTLKRRGRKVIMPAGGSLVNSYFSIEEFNYDMGKSRFFQDCLWKSVKIAMAPNGIITFEPSWVGTGSMVLESSAVLTTPTLPTSQPLAALDAVLSIGGVDQVDLTSFDVTIDNAAVAPAVAGSKVSPTVLPGMNTVVMNLKFLRKDTTWDADFLNETSLSLKLMAVDQTTEPKNFISINVPYFTLGSADVSAMSTAGGAAETTISIPSSLVGHDPTGAGNDDTMISFQVSNNS